MLCDTALSVTLGKICHLSACQLRVRDNISAVRLARLGCSLPGASPGSSVELHTGTPGLSPVTYSIVKVQPLIVTGKKAPSLPQRSYKLMITGLTAAEIEVVLHMYPERAHVPLFNRYRPMPEI